VIYEQTSLTLCAFKARHTGMKSDDEIGGFISHSPRYRIIFYSSMSGRNSADPD